MGGIIVMQAGSGGVEYIFTEKNFGQFASNEEVKALLGAFSELFLPQKLIAPSMALLRSGFEMGRFAHFKSAAE